MSNKSHRGIQVRVVVILIILIAVAVSVALFVMRPNTTYKGAISDSSSSGAPAESQASSTTASSVPKLIIGDPSAKVTIVEYGDFKCPLCGRFFRETEPQIKKDYIDSGRVNIEYRPLPIIAKDSTVAALGAYCSAEQGKFEAYHGAVFRYIYDNHYSKSLKDEFSNIFTLERLTQIASEQGINTQSFETCMTSNKYSAAIEASEASAKADGASSTPTFVIGKAKVSGAQPFSIFRPLIDAQLRWSCCYLRLSCPYFQLGGCIAAILCSYY